MKNKVFIKSTLILMISAFLTKLLGFIIKIIYTRIIGEKAISLYVLITPTYSLLITIASLSLQIALSKLIAENNNSKKIIINTIFIIIVTNILLISLSILSSGIIAKLLNERRCKTLIIACSFTLPFISISAMLKGYFFGKQKMHPYAISNVVEQIIRLTLISLILPYLIEKSIMYAIIGLILLSIISEISSIIIFILFLPKKKNIKIYEIKPEKRIIKDILGISLPTMSSRIIGNIGYFFEPIILTFILLKLGYSSSYIKIEYGIFNAYTISLLTMPSFFINALSQALIPEISKNINNKKIIIKRIKQSILFAFIIGFISSIGILIFRNKLLFIIFNTTKGGSYIKVLAPFFVLFYIESPLISILQALKKSITTLKITTYGIIIKSTFLILLAFFKIGIYNLVISEIINIIFVVILLLVSLNKTLKKIT